MFGNTINSLPRVWTTLALLAGGAFSSGCVVADHQSYASPRDALLTYQAALARDDEEREWFCLSEQFKRKLGTLARYKVARDLALHGNAMLRFWFVRNDLDDNIVHEEYSADGNDALLRVELWGSIIDFRFHKEVLLTLRSAGEPDLAAYLERPASEVFALRDTNEISLRVPGELAPPDPRALRAALVEERWKIADFARIEE
ncbi:MAG: hypothetical protein U1E76_20660 [Planctomycetota bacterium]